MPTQMINQAGTTASGISFGTSSIGLRPQHFLVCLMGLNATASSDTVVTTNISNPALEFRQIGRCATATQSVVASLLWGIDPNGGNVNLGTSPSSTTGRTSVLSFDGPGVQNSSINATMLTATGSSSVVETPLITPTAGDLLIAFAFWNSTTLPSSVVDSPGGKDGMFGLANATTTNFCLVHAYRLSASAVPHKRTWNLSASQVWGAGIIAVTPAPGTVLTTTGLYKGRGTKTLDAMAGA